MDGSVAAKKEKPKSTVKIRRSLTENDPKVTGHVYGSVTTKEEKPKSSGNVRRPLTDNDKEAITQNSGSVTTKEKEPKSRDKARRLLTETRKEKSAVKFGSVTAEDKKPKSTVTVRRPATGNDKEVKAHKCGSLTAKKAQHQSTVKVRRPLTENDKETTAHKYRSVSATEKHKSAENVRQMLTETAENKKPKSTVKVPRPSTKLDKEVTVYKLGSVTAKEEKPKNKVNAPRHLLGSKKEETAHKYGSVTAKEKPKRTENVQRMLTEIDEEKKADKFGSVTSEDGKPKSTVKVRRPSTEIDKNITVHKFGPVTAKEVKPHSKVTAGRTLTENDKEVSAQMFGSETTKERKAQSTDNIRRPSTEKDKGAKTHKYGSLIAKEKKLKNTVNVRRQITKTEEKETADKYGSVTVNKNKQNSADCVRRPLTANDKNAGANIRSPLSVKQDETISNENDRRFFVANDEKDHLSGQDQKTKSKKHIRRPFTSGGDENKNRKFFQRPLTAKARQVRNTTKSLRAITTQDSLDKLSLNLGEARCTNEILGLLSAKGIEEENTTCIRQSWTTKEKEENTKCLRQQMSSGDTATVQNLKSSMVNEFLVEDEISTRNSRPEIETNVYKVNKDCNTIQKKVSEGEIVSGGSIGTDSKLLCSANLSSNYKHTENDLNLKLLSKPEAFTTFIAFSDRSKDEDTAETSENVSKNEAVDGQCSLRCVEGSEKRFKHTFFNGAAFDLDKASINQAELDKPLSDDNEGEDTTTMTETSDAKSALKMQSLVLTKVGEKHIYFREDEKETKQKIFVGSVTGAKSSVETSMTKEKYKNFQAKVGISSDVQEENSDVATWTDERTTREMSEKQEHKTKQYISDTQYESLVRKSKELNGCRPKQKISFQVQDNVKSQACRTKYHGNVFDNPKETRLSLMFGLIDEDPCVILYELTKSPLLLPDCIDCISKDEHSMFVFLQILSKAFSSNSSPQSMIMLFETLKQKGYFDILAEYLTRIIIEIKTGEADSGTCEQMLKHILSILVEQMTRNPSSVVVFRKLHALLSQVIDELVESGTVDDEVIAKYELFTEQKKVTEKERKQSSEPKRYIKPPDDFRDYSVPPTADEITGKVKPFLRQNTIEGGYEDLNDYLDVQFRLLREDFVGPLREGMTGYIDLMTSKKGYKNTRECLKDLDIKVYENVRVHSPVVTQHGLCYKLKLQMTASLKRTQWKFSKRLIYGSMVCLTDKDFQDFLLATVVEREEKDIKRGYFTVHFEREDVSTKDLLKKVFRMAETSGYFEAYRHVLFSLQTLKNGDLPFEKYIVKCEKEMSFPAYVTPSVTYDLRPLVDQNVKIEAVRRFSISGLASMLGKQRKVEFSQRSNVAKVVRITDRKNWPRKELLKMDDSQYRAVQTALTSEFAIIQGPPGTGKTYIGLQIVKALLHNKSAWAGIGRYHKPMLIVCYTNHALDQFLEGIVKYFEGDVLRVGGRSNSTGLEKYNLKKYRQIRFKKGSTLASLQFEKRQARRHMEAQSRCVQSLSKTIQMYRSEIVSEDVLASEMDERLYENLVSGYRGKDKLKGSYIVTWLGIDRLENECKKEIQNLSKAKKGKHVHVNDEVTHVLKERMLDVEENVHFSENERSILQKIRKTDVAFYVEDANKTQRKKGKESEREDTQAKMFKKKFQYTLAGKITDENVMSQKEADNIKDIWRLNRNSRWRLYRLWIQKLCAKLYEQIETNREYFEEAAQEYQGALMQVDKEIMKHVAVIGMTTSGAARYQSVLRDIGPRIIVVEEAAEVLEAHIITTLSKGCEHLILIGDHKQLRPNPTVYKLAVKYNLDISLFERMVKNEMQFNCLELQHRMRPEISSIMRHIYPDLKDHDHVKAYPNVKGIATNLFLINHAHLESSDGDIKSYSNTKEAEYAVALCRYLLLQGYERQDVTVLTTYTGQLMCMRNIMPKEEFEGVNVTVVDNYQGEENKIVILSLVRSNTINKIGFLKIENRICVALSRAKIGFFVLGNFDHLANHSALWKEIVTDMKSKKCFGNGLVLYCQNHPNDNAIIAKDHEDFKRAPEGGCMKKCSVRLECGHKCERYCHVLDKEHKTNKCQKPCTKILCEYGHECPDECYIECSPCRVMRIKTIPTCGHTQLVPCATKPEDFCCRESCEKKLHCGHPCKNICGKPHTSKCMEEINFIWSCGHNSQIRCWEAKSKLCPRPCGTKLQCNHICSGTCGTCLMGKVHQPCRERCVLQHICGHRLFTNCQNYPICDKPCENECEHRRCTKKCGEPCDPCMKPCPWKCPHKICRRFCGEPCDRPGCNFPCKKLLKCKHKCVGLCGEPCPRICRVCHLERFKEETFGDSHIPDARYILLEDCGHLAEYHAMDAYMAESDSSGKLHFKHCPKCKTPIRNCQRYGSTIKHALRDIESAKRGIIGDLSMYYTIKRNVLVTLQNVNENSNTCTETGNCRSEIRELEDRLDDLKLSGLLTERQLLTVKKQCEIANEIIILTQNIRDCQQSLKYLKTKNVAATFLQELLQIVLRPRNILTKQEHEDISQEIQRGQDFLKLMKMQNSVQSLEGAEEAHTYIQRIESVLLDHTRFTPEKRKNIDKHFENLTHFLKTVTEQDSKVSV